LKGCQETTILSKSTQIVDGKESIFDGELV